MSDSDREEEADLSDATVVTKYKTAAEISNRVLVAVKNACKAGAKLVDIANIGDEMIDAECGKIFKSNKDMTKGIAFPTCLSVDHCVGHYSPWKEDETTLADGALVKIDLGVHIDGYVAVQATSVVVQSTPGPITGRHADVIACANTCFEAALRLIRPGKSISAVSPPLNEIAAAFGCSMVEGVMTHNVKQFVMDGEKCVVNKLAPDQKVEDGKFEENEVFSVDIVVSTGEGKARVLDEKKTSVYKRSLSEEYRLKMKSSRQILSDIAKRYPAFPFPLRKLLEQSSASKIGLVECVSHGLVEAYPVLWEKEGELVAHVKGTVLLMKNGSDRITPSNLQELQTDKSLEGKDELKALLQQSIKAKKPSKGKKKKADAAPS